VGSYGSPFVQRCLAQLIETQTPFKYTNIDLQNKPDWFLQSSPLAKVPFLRLSDGKVLFESLVILEFIDSLLPTEKQVTPKDPYIRAENRAWIEYLDSSLMEVFVSVYKPTSEEFEALLPKTAQRFAAVEEQIKGPFWNGDKLSLIDFAAAPMLYRVIFVDNVTRKDVGNLANFPKVRAWVAKLLSHPCFYQAAALQLDPEYGNQDIGVISSFQYSSEEFLKDLREVYRKKVKPRFPGAYFTSLL